MFLGDGIRPPSRLPGLAKGVDMIDTAQDIEKLQVQVEDVMAKYSYARNSDKVLSWLVWQLHYDVGDYVDKMVFMSLPSGEEIARIRRKVQEEGRYPPTSWEVARQRRWKEDEWLKAMGYPEKWEKEQALMF